MTDDVEAGVHFEHKHQDYTKPSSSGKQYLPPEESSQLLSVMMVALQEHPDASDLSQDILIKICEDALQEQTFSDAQWLEARLKLEKLNAASPVQAAMADSKKSKELQKLKEINPSPPCQPQSEEEWQTLVRRHQNWIQSVIEPKRDVESGRANLNGADLRSFDLSGLDLRGVLLEGANLENCQLIRTNLATAKLKNANLKGANLESANLRRADLTKAELDGAILRKTDLRRAIFDPAILKVAVESESATLD